MNFSPLWRRASTATQIAREPWLFTLENGPSFPPSGNSPHQKSEILRGLGHHKNEATIKLHLGNPSKLNA